MSAPRPAPKRLTLIVAGALALQLWTAYRMPRPEARAQDLPPPPATEVLRFGAVGDPIALGQGLTLWLQAFDNQPGISIPYTSLDYDRAIGWLERLMGLDTKAQYPLLMATHFYGQVPDLAKVRKMFEFTHRRFLEDPNRRWPWLAHAAIMARHRLKDPQLALDYADDLARHATAPAVPGWARQMHILLRADLGAVESARVLLGGLLASGEVTDEHEKRFLIERLDAAQQGETSSKPSKSHPLAEGENPPRVLP